MAKEALGMLTPEAQAIISIPSKLDSLIVAFEKMNSTLETLNGTLQDLVEATVGEEPRFTIKGGGIAFDGLKEQ